MGGRRVALISIAAAITATAASRRADAQAQEAGGEIEMEPASPVEAKPSAPPTAAPDRKAAHQWLVAGQLLMKKARFLASRNRPDDAKAQLEQANAAFHKSLAANDDPNVRYELALAIELQGKLDEAFRQLRLVLATKETLRPAIAGKAAFRLGELATRVGVVTLTVAPAGASITLGGIELGTAPLAEPLVLMPGTYTLSFLAEGFQPKEAEITVEPGSEVKHAVALDAIRVIVRPVQPIVIREAEPPPPPPPRSKLPLVVGAAITGVAAAGATVLGILALGRHATFIDPRASTTERDDARTSGKRLALEADVAIGTAVVAAGFTAGWYLFKYRQHPEKQEDRRPPPVDAKLDVVPWVQAQSAGVTIAGWF